MKNIYIKTILIAVLAIMPAVSSAYMLDPYPINANDNRTVYNAAVTTSLALMGQNQNPVYTTAPVTTAPQQIVVPAQTTYAVNSAQPAVVYSNASANSGTQTFAGVGSNNYASTVASQPVYTTNSQPSVASNSWTYNLPTQSLMPATSASTQYVLNNPKLVAMDTNFKYSYANALPSYYGAGATNGVYTTYGGQSYDSSAIYNKGLALATGNSTNTTNTNYYSNTNNYSGSSGEWVQTSGGWKQIGVRQVTEGHMPW